MNLRKMGWYGMVALGLIMFCRAAWAEEEAPAETEGISATLDLSYVTKNVWRGLVVNDDPALQPSLTLAHPNGLSLNFWGTLDTTDIAGERGNITEIDYTLDYEWSEKNIGLNAGVSYFTYPNVGGAESGEVYAAACFGGAWAPSLAVNYDFKDIKGTYLSFGIGQDCSLTPSKAENPLLLGLYAQVGYGTAPYNKGYFGVDKSTFNDVLVSASLPLTVNDRLTLTPAISYAAFLDDEIKDGARDQGSDTSTWFGGVTASYTF